MAGGEFGGRKAHEVGTFWVERCLVCASVPTGRWTGGERVRRSDLERRVRSAGRPLRRVRSAGQVTDRSDQLRMESEQLAQVGGLVAPRSSRGSLTWKSGCYSPIDIDDIIDVK